MGTTNRPSKPTSNPGSGYEWKWKVNRWVKAPSAGSKTYGPLGLRFGPGGPPSIPATPTPAAKPPLSGMTFQNGRWVRSTYKPQGDQAARRMVSPSSSSSDKKVVKPSSTSSGSGSSGSPRAGGSSSQSNKPRKPPARKPVLQQNTEWVKKGQTVGGKVVTKGYLAQKGKPEKRVTARVKIQTATESGKKAGSTYAYKAGKTIKKVGKK